ncbi:MAG: L-aspartate oxidase [uncultured Sulfurovum sp.]|uniref:L-aspartate oxidase n=1 Tax=uncultured Sulfurovum sp. TaxID=269237 RepID=A0A6S6T798_9BACT|nr:MAG: L-aspartate oxidase [uncultured Sulfurovum sp.]
MHHENDKIYKRRLRKIMWEDMGVIRTKKGLLEAKNEIFDMKNRDIGRLLELRLNTASAIVEAALKRKESLGTHYIE